MTRKPKCFISYSHKDREVAKKIADALLSNDLDVWIDTLQILPGDSLIQKIFEEGLKDCELFLVLLSPTSVESDWVRHELDIALINRLNKITRVIPVVIEDCEIPVALRSLRWLNLRGDFDNVIQLITLAALGKSPTQSQDINPPAFVNQIITPKGGLSQTASIVGAFIAKQLSTVRFPNPLISGKDIQEQTELSSELINDSIDELSSHGMVKIHYALGTHPFEFAFVEPQYLVAYTFPEFVEGEIAPPKDVKEVASVVAFYQTATGQQISEKLGFEPNRINFAVDYLLDYGLVETYNYIGTAPYSFGEAVATRSTRQFAEDKDYS